MPMRMTMPITFTPKWEFFLLWLLLDIVFWTALASDWVFR